MSDLEGLFWNDLRDNLRDPDYLREFVAQWVRIQTIDRVINALDDARTTEGLSKAELARAINARPESIRRLFSAEGNNPTLGTVAEIAAALGFEITIRPMGQEKKRSITEPLRTGRATKRTLQLAKKAG